MELRGAHVTWSGHRCREVTRKKLQEQKKHDMYETVQNAQKRELHKELQDI